MNQKPAIEDLFDQLVELKTPKEREEFLQKQCGNDRDLRDRLEKLLSAHEDAGSFLADDDVADETLDSDSSDLSGETIGPYKLREAIGEGGMGTVYVAEQEKPLRRKVALKVIKPGMDSKAVIARFEAERQALAMMDHPNIAKVLDAGTTEYNRPYFVMELVKGVSITQYCDENKLSTEERLKLFIDVCNALQHAHQKGVIHRDLKPSNVLVAQYDNSPIPKVIDFGVAKATQQKLTEKTVYTQLGQIVGTLEYMSPEQAVMNQLDIDTRADVYSLGVILYELLVGETPLCRTELNRQGFEYILRSIRELEPVRPSVRLSSQGQAATQTAAYRQTDESSLSRTLRGDLDWVVMKALEKDRKRRYASATHLAEDLSNYLRGIGVTARPPTFSYRMIKACHRNRTAVVLTAVVLASLLIIMGNLWFSNQRLRRVIVGRDEALSKWRHVLLDQGIESAFRGDIERTEQIAQDAEQAEAANEWIQLMRGVARMISGETDKAVDMLSMAHVNSPNNLSVACALVMCSIGDRGAFISENMGLRESGITVSELISSLDGLRPSEEFGRIDRLFRGWTQLYEEPKRAVATLEDIVNADRPWSVSQAFLAMARVHYAADTGDPEIAMKALDEIRRCEEHLGDSPFAMFVALHCRTAALQFASEVMADDERSAVYHEALQLAESLGRFPNGWAADFRAGFYELIDADVTESVYKRTRNDWWCANRAGVLLRSDPDWLCDRITPDNIGTPLQAVGDASALAILDRPQQAEKIYEQLRELRIWPVRLGALEILLLLGKERECTQRSREFLEEIKSTVNFFDPPFWHFEKRLRFLAEEPGYDEHAFLTSLGGSLYGECNANYLIALKLRSRGKKQRAKDYSKACVDTKQFWMWPYQFSKSILQREYGILCPPRIQEN